MGAGRIEVRAGQLVNLGVGTGKGGQPLLAITGEPITIGGYVRLTFSFSGGSSATVNVPIVGTDPEDGPEFLDVPLPTPATPSADATDSAAGDGEEGDAE